MTAMKLLAVFRKFPKEIFRVNNGRKVELRTWTPRRRLYDISTTNGRVQPKAMQPQSYEGKGSKERLLQPKTIHRADLILAPNGASMRPNSPYQQSLVSWRFQGDDMVVYAVPEGTALPDDLLLVHERSDHYSLQPAVSMSITGECTWSQVFCASINISTSELNEKMTHFLRANAKAFTREQWLEKYPEATESS